MPPSMRRPTPLALALLFGVAAIGTTIAPSPNRRRNEDDEPLPAPKDPLDPANIPQMERELAERRRRDEREGYGEDRPVFGDAFVPPPDETPADPRCRPWNSREEERRRKQIDRAKKKRASG